MCLILFAYRIHPEYPLIVAANRDEFYQRPTANAHFWEDDTQILAGRDLEKMGTWMGVTTTGRFAALTNYRDPMEESVGKRSRGELVADALKYEGSVNEYMQALAENNQLYPGYNLLAGNLDELYYYSNVGKELVRVQPGIYGLSNHLLNTQWPKVKIGTDGMTQVINENQEDIVESLMTLLQLADPAPDEVLPKTGVPFELEKMLSPLFIKSENYGTRSSTVLIMDKNQIHFNERVYANEKIIDQQYLVDLKK